MPLSYETSSLSYDDVDLIYGKFIPAHVVPSPFSGERRSNRSKSPVRIFCNIYGVFADMTGRFAEKYDNHVVPCRLDCIIDETYVRNNISRDAVIAIVEEPEFWLNMEAYPWYKLLIEQFFNMCGGEYFLLLSFYDCEQLTDRVQWVWRHFGIANSRDRTIVMSSDSYSLLVKSRNDILIDSDLLHCEKWSQAGGSAFFWPEIDSKCKDPSGLLYKRLKLLSDCINDLKGLSRVPWALKDPIEAIVSGSMAV